MSGRSSDELEPMDRVKIKPGGIGAFNEKYALDINALIDLVGDNPEKHCLLLKKYAASANGGIKEIRTACENQDAEPIRRQSQKLKSFSRSIGADGLACVFQSLESAGEAARWHEIEIHMTRIEYIFRKVEACIENLCSRNT